MADQYKIPQNIDIEDKIFGPFTLKQFLYLMAAAVIIYVLYNIIGTTDFQLFIIVSLPVLIVAIALVFVKVNERPFISFVAYFSEYLKQGKEKKWQKSAHLKVVDLTTKISDEEKSAQKEFEKMAKKGIVRSQLNQLSIILDTSGWSGDMIDENLQGRISSDSNSASVIQKTLGKEELEDVFAELEQAFDKNK